MAQNPNLRRLHVLIPLVTLTTLQQRVEHNGLTSMTEGVRAAVATWDKLYTLIDSGQHIIAVDSASWATVADVLAEQGVAYREIIVVSI